MTPKQQRFVDEYLIDLNATQAAIRAGYSAKNADKIGSELLGKTGVAEAIQQAQQKRSERTEVTADQVLERWDRRARSTAEDFLVFREVTEPTERWVTAEEAIAYYQKEVEIERAAAQRLGLTGKEAEAHDKELDAMERKIVRLEVRMERDPNARIRIPGPLETRIVADFDLAAMRDAGRLDLIRSVQRDKDGGLKVQMHDAAAADEAIAKHLGMFGAKGTPDDPIHTVQRTVTDEERQKRLDELRKHA